MTPGACVFDLGNTLVPDVILYNEVLPQYGALLAARGVVSNASQFTDTYTRINKRTRTAFLSHTYGEESFFADAFSELGVSAVTPAAALAEYRAMLMARMSVAPPSVAALRYLRERGIAVVLLSNESVARVDAFFDKTGLRDLFDDVMVSQAVGYEKPDIRIFELLLDRLGMEASRVIMFGDNAIADGACRKLGITFVLVTTYRDKEWAWEEGNVHRPDHVMELIDPERMEGLLRKWGGHE